METRKKVYLFLAIFCFTLTVILLALLFAVADSGDSVVFERALLYGGIPTVFFALLAWRVDSAIQAQKRHDEIAALLRAIGKRLERRA